VAVLGPDDRVIEFAEKPQSPKSGWGVPPLYVFPRDTLPRIAAYLVAGGARESPGQFIQWLCRREPVHAYRIRGSILDIGTPESLEHARRSVGESAD
jgi:glucose-1-phosphate thymidylyltransferase